MGNHSPLNFLDFHASQEVKNPRKRSIDSSSSEKSLFVFVFRSKVRNSAELFQIICHLIILYFILPILMWSGFPQQIFYFKVNEAEFPRVVVKEEDATLSESSRLSLADTQSRYAQLHQYCSQPCRIPTIAVINSHFKRRFQTTEWMCKGTNQYLFLLGFHDPMLGSRLAGIGHIGAKVERKKGWVVPQLPSSTGGWKVSSAIVQQGFESTLISRIFLISHQASPL